MPLGRKPGNLGSKMICPVELEERRANRLRQAFSKKCPKLKHAKDEGARTLLVLENEDVTLASFDLIGNLIPNLLAERGAEPDEIYLAETHTDPWWVWPMKLDGDHWSTADGSELKWTPTPFDGAGLGNLSGR